MSVKTSTYSISIEAVTENLLKIRRFITQRAIEHGLPEPLTADLILAVDEACTNIIRHAYKNKPQKALHLEIGFEEKEVRIKITDKGKSFDPAAYTAPDVMQKIKNKQRGGLGIYLIRSLMDQVHYSSEDGTNEIIMTKNR